MQDVQYIAFPSTYPRINTFVCIDFINNYILALESSDEGDTPSTHNSRKQYLTASPLPVFLATAINTIWNTLERCLLPVHTEDTFPHHLQNQKPCWSKAWVSGQPPRPSPCAGRQHGPALDPPSHPTAAQPPAGCTSEAVHCTLHHLTEKRRVEVIVRRGREMALGFGIWKPFQNSHVTKIVISHMTIWKICNDAHTWWQNRNPLKIKTSDTSEIARPLHYCSSS